MSEHDRLCPGRAGIADVWPSACQCELVAEVRADQDDRECDHCTDLARLKITDLRAKVEALSRAPLSPLDWVLRADVLALLDGEVRNATR